MNMPDIKECDADQCAYNKDSHCHAMAITVGGPHPACDTYFQNNSKGGGSEMAAGVGACKVANCVFNQAFECSATGISVRIHSNHADCSTFKAR